MIRSTNNKEFRIVGNLGRDQYHNVFIQQWKTGKGISSNNCALAQNIKSFDSKGGVSKNNLWEIPASPESNRKYDE